MDMSFRDIITKFLPVTVPVQYTIPMISCAICAAIAEELARAYREISADSDFRSAAGELSSSLTPENCARLSRAIMLKFAHEVETGHDVPRKPPFHLNSVLEATKPSPS